MSKIDQVRDWANGLPPHPTDNDCQRLLDELDKPELDEQHRSILSLLKDRKGYVCMVDDEWVLTWKEKSIVDCMVVTRAITAMIKAELLSLCHPCTNAGMAKYVDVTEAGREAIK